MCVNEYGNKQLVSLHLFWPSAYLLKDISIYRHRMVQYIYIDIGCRFTTFRKLLMYKVCFK